MQTVLITEIEMYNIVAQELDCHIQWTLRVKTNTKLVGVEVHRNTGVNEEEKCFSV